MHAGIIANRSLIVYTGDMPLDPVPLGQPISELYNYSLRLVGLAAFVMLIYAGLIYMLPDDLRKKWGTPNPWDVIKDVIIGVILLFSAYVILNTINPDLVQTSIATKVALLEIIDNI